MPRHYPFFFDLFCTFKRTINNEIRTQITRNPGP